MILGVTDLYLRLPSLGRRQSRHGPRRRGTDPGLGEAAEGILGRVGRVHLAADSAVDGAVVLDLGVGPHQLGRPLRGLPRL